MAVMQQELPACGAQAERVKAEVEQGLQQAQQRLEAEREARQREEEALAKAQELLTQFKGLVEVAEAAAASLKDAAKVVLEKDDLSEMNVSAIDKLLESVDAAAKDAREKVKACSDMAVKDGTAMRVADQHRAGAKRPVAAGEDAEQPEAGTERLTLAPLTARMGECSKALDQTLASCRSAAEKGKKKVEARAKIAELHKLFDKYSKGGIMSKTEVKKYAQSEFKFKLTDDATTGIFRALVEEGAKGVKKDDFQKLKVAVGVARERELDAQRRKVRVEREERLAKLKAGFQSKLEALGQTLDACAEGAAKAEAEAAPLFAKGRTMTSLEMMPLADEVDATLKGASEEVDSAKKNIAGLAEDVEAELKVWVSAQQKLLEQKARALEARLAKAQSVCAKFRADAERRAGDELVRIERKVVSMLRYHQSKKDVSCDDLFAAIDGNKDDKVDVKELVDFFKTCEREPIKKEVLGKKEAKKEEDGEVKDELEDGAEVELTAAPSEEELSRLCKHMGEGDAIEKEDFCSAVRLYLRVVKESVLTDELSTSDSKVLRKLEVGEIIEVLAGPVSEESGVERVRCKAMKDGQLGFTTWRSNTATAFLEERGKVWKVVAETLMTGAFELDDVSDSSRKLKVGELLEVRVWPSKEESSGMTRMKCRSKADGKVGFVTTVGNQGTVYVEVL
eukprot:SRR837773.386.p1 GENE.SRR837773.386~~SRR837773.386.p1  ORF type:complete len:679 (+),score=265.83 SRR837773.386:608-2644(+)